MDNNRGQSIFLSVVGIATLLVAIIGATFAYFSISVTGNDTASSITVTTARVGGVTYSGGTDKIEATDVYPGWSAQKTFTISSDSTADATANIDYDIVLHTTADSLSSQARTNGTHEFIYTLSGSETSGSGGTLAPAKTYADHMDVPLTTGGNGISAADTVIGQGRLHGASNTHSYTFTVLFEEQSKAQDLLQGLSYTGIIQIVVGGADGQKRTWDINNGGWTTYPIGS